MSELEELKKELKRLDRKKKKTVIALIWVPQF